MGLRDMTTAAMVSLTGSWVDPAHEDRQALERIPAVEAFLPHVEEAHRGLLETQVDGRAKRLASLSSAQRDLDARHDSLARGIRLILDGLVHLARAPEQAERLRALQELLFPDGLMVVRYSYREEAGYAALLAARLTAADEAALAAIPTPEGSLLALVREWMKAAGEIGALEDERGGTPMPATTSMRARGQWIRVMSTLRTLIDTIGTEDPGVLELLHRLDLVSQQATRRPGGDAPPAGDEPEGPDDDDPETGSAIAAGEPGDDAASDGARVLPFGAKEPPAS